MKVYTIHSVSDNGLSLNISLFRRFLIHIKKTSYFVNPSDLYTGKIDDGVLLTFDDCYSDNFCNALPLLTEFGVKALFFFTPGYTGTVRWGSRTKGNWSDYRSDMYDIPYSFMGLAELKTLINLGHDIGFHSRSHRNLDECTHDELVDEIFIAKTECEKLIGQSFRSFAYPRGRFDERMYPIIENAGYFCAFSTQLGLADQAAFKSNRFCLPRLPIQRKGFLGWL
jgi:peptidoglycan/xylan/chitin deacetylase (PgdA/CDA1 family)